MWLNPQNSVAFDARLVFGKQNWRAYAAPKPEPRGWEDSTGFPPVAGWRRQTKRRQVRDCAKTAIKTKPIRIGYPELNYRPMNCEAAGL